MSKSHTKQYHIKKVNEYLHKITQLGPDDGVAFVRYKKKAAKHLQEAKIIEQSEQLAR